MTSNTIHVMFSKILLISKLKFKIVFRIIIMKYLILYTFWGGRERSKCVVVVFFFSNYLVCVVFFK